VTEVFPAGNVQESRFSQLSAKGKCASTAPAAGSSHRAFIARLNLSCEFFLDAMFYSCREIDSQQNGHVLVITFNLHTLLRAPCSLRRDASCESPIRPCDTRLFEDIDPGFRVCLATSVYLFSLAFSRTSSKHRISIKRITQNTRRCTKYFSRQQMARFAIFDATRCGVSTIRFYRT